MVFVVFANAVYLVSVKISIAWSGLNTVHKRLYFHYRFLSGFANDGGMLTLAGAKYALC